YLRRQNYDYEIIVVSDGSRDDTVNLAKSLEPSIRGLRLIDNKENHGKGYVVKQGVLEARGDLRLFTDADNSTSIDHLDHFIPYINEGFGVVIGSIAVAGHKVASGSEPMWRRILGKLGNLFIQIVAVPGIYDTQRGFKLFTAKAVQDIFPKLTITRWGFDIEALALARKFGYKIKELPVDWKNDPNSKVGLKAYIQVLIETMKVRWNLMTRKYDKSK
ncbi:MAG: glycosyltransferase family 2 protein, partial [Candidatus Taylorbacteria bacterium]|nr:glycosyltransferase family 2 protein [Candidatus Taylorbacteria bacterium]